MQNNFDFLFIICVATTIQLHTFTLILSDERVYDVYSV